MSLRLSWCNRALTRCGIFGRAMTRKCTGVALGILVFVMGPDLAWDQLPVFFFKQKTAYDIGLCLEFRRVLFRSLPAPRATPPYLCQRYLSRNAPLLSVQQQGGWRSAAVLLRVYARWIRQDFESVLAQQAAATDRKSVV